MDSRRFNYLFVFGSFIFALVIKGLLGRAFRVDSGDAEAVLALRYRLGPSARRRHGGDELQDHTTQRQARLLTRGSHVLQPARLAGLPGP